MKHSLTIINSRCKGWTAPLRNAGPAFASCIGGAICIVLGLVLFFVGKKKDAPLPEKQLDVGEVLNKYLMEEKMETFFD